MGDEARMQTASSDVSSVPVQARLESACTTPDSTARNTPVTLGSRSSLVSTLVGITDEKTKVEKIGFIPSEKGSQTHKERIEELGQLVTPVNEEPTFQDPEGILERRGKRRMKLWKAGFSTFILGFK